MILLLVFFTAERLFSQDTLPGFTIVEGGDKVVISWTNPYPNLVQLNVQRSYDSLKFYSTIFSAPSPGIPQNGYTDTKKPANHVYYRIFYVLEGGRYFFSRVRSASGALTNYSGAGDVSNLSLLNAISGNKRMVTIQVRKTTFKQLSVNAFRNFRDSILHLTKDTLFYVNDSLVGLSPYAGQQNYKASPFIYINKEGYINISLPLNAEKKYSIKFYEENGSLLFDINNVKESPLIIDKSNFVHAGWFLFELYEDNKLKEKNKLYLPKDF